MTTTPTPQRTDRSSRRPQAGPPLLVPVLGLTALTIAYVVVNRSTPPPGASGLEVLNYAQDHAATITLGSFLLFASAVPLALTTAGLYRRLRALGITAPGSAITLVGGVLAANALALSAMFGWSGGRLSADAGPALARALADLSYLAGGPAYSMMFALLVAGVSVPGLLAGLLPRAMGWAGLVLAAAGALSTLALLVDAFAYLLPVVRFGGLLWLVLAAVFLPRTRRSRDR